MPRGLVYGGLGLGLGLGLGFGAAKSPLLNCLGIGKRAIQMAPRLPAALGAPQTGLMIEPSKYPSVRRDESVVDYMHGVSVADPYRWLEDPDSPETLVDAQNALSNDMFSKCETREAFKGMFTKLFDYAKYGTPFKRGDRYYYYYNSGLQQQYVIYSQAQLGGEATVLLDPNTFSEDGTVALKDIEFSDDGTLLAYSTSSGGSDWSEIQVMSVDGKTGSTKKLDDKLEYVKFSSMSWTHDNKGFFYNRYEKPSVSGDLGTETDINTNQQLCYHVLGTPQSEDTLIFTMPEHPTWMAGSSVTDDGRYLVMYVSEGCQPANRIYLVDMQALTERLPDGSVDWKAYEVKKGRKPLPLVKLVDDFSASFSCVANNGSQFIFTTNLNAPRYRIVTTDVSKPTPPSTWPDLVAQHDKDVLKGAVALKGDNLIVRYLRDVRGALQLRSLATGKLVREISLPGVGTVTGFSGDRKYTEGFFSFTSFVEPGATYRMDLADPAAEPILFRRTELRVPHDPTEYVTKQVFVPSRDGVRVPLFITHRKDVTMDGTNPTLLYGYGGFNISLEPGFSASRLAFMKGFKGVFAQASLRGGGEYGVEWRNAGSKENKQNVFNDFQACAEYLHAAGYCSPSKLTIQGGSNGGLLVAACANQRPDLYACVIGQVGVMDMMRFHKFTIGHAWTTDYGCSENAEEFKYMLPYSPLHNVRVPKGGSGQYPAILLATGDHDDRVVPLHSYKLLAELQHQLAGHEGSQQRNPLVIRIEVRAGHGAGKPTQKVIDETADLYGFAAKCMNAAWVDTPVSTKQESAAVIPVEVTA